MKLVPTLSFCLLTFPSVTSFSPAASNKGSLQRQSSTELHYEIQRDPSNENVWSVLTTTEKWVAATLSDAGSAISGGAPNPWSRKEVSYVCETSTDPAMIIATIFRKVKEAREMGENHAQEQEEQIDENDEHKRVTLRQTQVVVVPSNEEMMDFPVFDNLINTINRARRNARDLVTDVSLERLDENMFGDGDRDWCVSINCAHLHPKFGEKTPEQQLKELQEEEENGEIDLNLQEYKKRRLEARRSPYPSVVVEIRAVPPPEFTAPPKPFYANEANASPDPSEEVGPEVSPDLVDQLENLFSKSSVTSGSGLYDSIGSHIEEVSAISPMQMAQTWISSNDPLFDASTCAFTTSNTLHVDRAYEFVFTNLAMQTSQFLSSSDSAVDAGAQKRQYLVMPNFVTSSATSMEKFAMEVDNLIAALPSVRGHAEISCLHPEHIDEGKRSPVPIFVLQWKD